MGDENFVMLWAKAMAAVKQADEQRRKKRIEDFLKHNPGCGLPAEVAYGLRSS